MRENQNHFLVKNWCKMDKAVVIGACILADHTEVGAGFPGLRFYERNSSERGGFRTLLSKLHIAVDSSEQDAWNADDVEGCAYGGFGLSEGDGGTI
jgi:hypothetical protein